MKVSQHEIILFDGNEYLQFELEEKQSITFESYQQILTYARPGTTQTDVLINIPFLKLEHTNEWAELNFQDKDSPKEMQNQNDKGNALRILVGKDFNDKLVRQTYCYFVRNNLMTHLEANASLKEVYKILNTDYTPLLGCHVYPSLEEFTQAASDPDKKNKINLKDPNILKEKRLNALANRYRDIVGEIPDEKTKDPNKESVIYFTFDCMHYPALLKQVILEIGEGMLENNSDAYEASQLISHLYQMFGKSVRDPNHAAIIQDTFKEILSQDLFIKVNQADKSRLKDIFASCCVDMFMNNRQASIHVQEKGRVKPSLTLFI